MTLSVFFSKVCRTLMKLRLKPIRVFCLHHVCQQFEADTMHECDWMELEEFKQKINALLCQGYQFISLTDAYNHLKKDWVRRKKFAVLTFDDGYTSMKEILPWLAAQNIPSTLFVNGKYLDGKSYRETAKERYLTYNELFALSCHLIEIGHHGWEHNKVTEMTNAEFIASIEKNKKILSKHPCYIPFFAYTYGIHSNCYDRLLQKNNLIPVLVGGSRNYRWTGSIDRELLT